MIKKSHSYISYLIQALFRMETDETQRMPSLTLDFCALENVGRLVTPAKKLEDTIRLAELVIEVLQQNEEHHAEVSMPTYSATHTHTGLNVCLRQVWVDGWLKEQ